MNMMNIGNRSLCSEVTDKSIVAYFYSLSNSSNDIVISVNKCYQLFLYIYVLCLTVNFYRAMLSIRGTSRGPVSVRLSQAGVLL